ncbi:uncharacterized protein LOC106663054 [Cimex lectularius]|uniref:Uncharacterized protein n=1 Tax=Cimex lectularius TaxID=79782 RepID=A0A8I6RBS5_CIMLE|nr:uncharacterized protein LOC106663054 [Cimex lectularius]
MASEVQEKSGAEQSRQHEEQQQQQQAPQQHQTEDRQGKAQPKKPPEILCNCPQKCQQRVPTEIRLGLYKEFSELGDHYRQNQYLQSYIEMRSVYKRLWCQEERVGGRLQRRVSCKYRIPLEIPKPIFETVQTHQPKLQTNSKGKAAYIVGIKDGVKTIEVCQKAFMNVYGITEKRIRLQREKLIAKLRSDSMEIKEKMEEPKAENHVSQVQQVTTQISEEQFIVDSFFRNQLWRPEYIGIPCDKLQYLDVYHNDVKA